MPLLGWSADHGDLRVAHFAGLHTMTLLTLAVGLVGRRQWSRVGEVVLVGVLGASSAVAFGLLLWQALRGEPLFQPDAAVLGAGCGWAMLTLGGLWLARTLGQSRMALEAR